MPYRMIVEDLTQFRLDLAEESELRNLANRYGVSLQALTLRISSIIKSSPL